MVDDNIRRFPISRWQKYKNEKGPNATFCFVSNRWVKFDGTAEWVGDTLVAPANIMTLTEDERDHKLCEFYFDLQELESLVAELKQRATPKPEN